MCGLDPTMVSLGIRKYNYIDKKNSDLGKALTSAFTRTLKNWRQAVRPGPCKSPRISKLAMLSWIKEGSLCASFTECWGFLLSVLLAAISQCFIQLTSIKWLVTLLLFAIRSIFLTYKASPCKRL
ncbi:hypothetical protein D3C72_1871660 [compost metagenome]